MSPEDLLMVLCIHGSKHCWERLGWICDVAEVVRANPELRWDEIMSRSSACHISRAVLLGLDLAESLLDAPVPELISRAIQNDRGVRRISALIQKRLFARSRQSRSAGERRAVFHDPGAAAEPDCRTWDTAFTSRLLRTSAI